MPLGDRTDDVVALLGRLDVLERLCDRPRHLRDLVDDTGQARSTVNRAINELADLGHVRRGSSGIEVTMSGRLARDRLTTLLDSYDDIVAAQAVLEPLDAQVDIDTAVVIGAESVPATDPVSYRPLERILDDLTDSSSIRALLPTLADPRTIGVLYELVVTGGNPVELVVTPDLYETLRTEFPRRTEMMAAEDHFSMCVGEVPPYGLALLTPGPADSGMGGTVVHLTVHNESGGLHGVLVNEREAAVDWAENRYRATLRDATERTASLVPNTDGGVTAIDAGAGIPVGAETPAGAHLPVSLERAGFRRIDAAYFQNAPVATPTTAWRAGLSLAEVHTGYAIDRFRPDGTEQNPSSESRGMAATLLEELAAGHHCIVIGPPGSGKSTVVKQVACEWYDAGRGTVLYREGGTGRTFDAVEVLLQVARSGSGDVLIVVEDAVRPDAVAIFEVIDRLTPEDAVHVLLDSRASEWSDTPVPFADRTDLEVVSLPPVRRKDCTRLIEHFQRTTHESVDVSTDQLWSTVDTGDAEGEEATHEMLRLIHRLATYADPLSTGPTALEEAVATDYEELVSTGGSAGVIEPTDEVLPSNVAPNETASHDAEANLVRGTTVALDVSTLVNALNVAGIEVQPAYCYALAPDDGLDAVDEAIERLEGSILFDDSAGGYRTVHEEWSMAFLTHLLEAEGEERAADRFGAVVSQLLALADDPTRRNHIARHLEDPFVLSDLSDDPTGWADEIVQALYTVGDEHGTLAALFGTGRTDSIELPEVCSKDCRRDRPMWAGSAFLAGGFYDRAERAFGQLSDDTPERMLERDIGIATAHLKRGDFDAAIERSEAGLSRLTELVETPAHSSPAGVDTIDSDTAGDARETSGTSIGVYRARLRQVYGDALSEQNQYEKAEQQYRLALEGVTARDNPRVVAHVQRKIGDMAVKQGEYDRSESAFESSLELARASGDLRLEADTLSNFGTIPWSHGDNDGAREYFERSLEIRRAIGDRHGIARSLYNLGILAKRESEYDLARELFEQSLEGLRAVNDSHLEVRVLGAFGLNLMRQGEYDRAQRHFEQWLDRSRELEDRHDEARALNNLGIVLMRRGRYETAHRSFERSLGLKREVGDTRGVSRTLGNIADVELEMGHFDRAEKSLAEAVELLEQFEGAAEKATPLTSLGLLSLEQGEPTAAIEYFERARTMAIDSSAGLKRAAACLGLAEGALLEGDLDRAEAFLDESATAIEGKRSPLELHLRLLRGRVALAANRLEDASAHADATATGATSIDAQPLIARSQRLRGRIAVAEGDLDLGGDQLRAALERFREIGAYPDAVETVGYLAEWAEVGLTPLDDWQGVASDILDAAPEECVDDELRSRIEEC